MALKDPNIPKPPEAFKNPNLMGEYMRQDSKQTQAFVKDLAAQVNWPVISSDPTEVPERVPMIKLDTRGWLWIYFNNAWSKYPADLVTQLFTLKHDLFVKGVAGQSGQIYGGFGGRTTASGAENDWNHADNARSGMGEYLLLGNASNGPGPPQYFHIFNFEYYSKDGSGNITQLAIPYGTDSGLRTGIWYRARYSGSWIDWRRIDSIQSIQHVSPNQATYSRYNSGYPNEGWSVWAPTLTVYDTWKENPVVLNNVITGLSCYLTVSGAGGLDTGSEAANTFYYVHVIWGRSVGVNAIFSTSYTNPTLPTGYTHFQVVDLVRNNASSNLHYHMRWGDDVWLYTMSPVYNNYTLTTSWQQFAIPAECHSSWINKFYLLASHQNASYRPVATLSSYTGYAWAQMSTLGYLQHGGVSNRYWGAMVELPIYNRGGYIYAISNYGSSYNNENLDVLGYKAPLFRV